MIISTTSAMSNEYFEVAATASFIHDLFRYPNPEQWDWLNDPDVKSTLKRLMQFYIPNFKLSISIYPDNYSDYEETFISTFEVGLPNPPCPLIESHWNKTNPIPKILHENILYYKKFGLNPKEKAKESSDHLCFQLEFYSYLTNIIANLDMESYNQEQYEQLINARAEYHQRHLMSWIPKALYTLQQENKRLWTVLWFLLLERFLDFQAE